MQDYVEQLDSFGEPQSAELTEPTAFDFEDSLLVDRAKNLLTEQVQAAESAKSLHMDRVQALRDVYDLKIPERTPAIPGGANVQSAMLRNKVEGFANLIADAVDQSPAFTIRARVEGLKSEALDFEEYLDSRMDSLEESGVGAILEEVALEASLTGVGCLKVGFEEIAGEGQLTSNVIQVEDLLVHPISAPKLSKAFFVANRFEMAYWQLLELFEAGEIENPASCIAVMADTLLGSRGYHDGMGHSNLNTDVSRDGELVSLLDCYVRFRVREDGPIEPYRFWFHAKSQTILKAEKNPFQHQRAPFALFHFKRRTGTIFGYSIAELLEQYQAELNGIINSRLDSLSLHNSPAIIAKRDSQVAKALREHGFEPGATYEADDPKGDIYVLAPAQANPISYQEQALLLQEADKVGITDSQLGQPLVRDQPTATQIRREMGAAQLRSSRALKSFQIGMREFAAMAVQCLYQFEVAPKGADGFAFFSSPTKQKLIQAETLFLDGLEIMVNGQETATARSERQNQAGLDLQVLLPLVAPNPQTGARAISDPMVWELASRYLDARGEKAKIDLIGAKPDPQQVAQVRAVLEQGLSRDQALIGGGGA